MELLIYKDSNYEYSYYFAAGDREVIHGEFKAFGNTGQLMEHSFFLDGLRHGESKEWYDNGVLGTRGFYMRGKMHGEYRIWKKDGQLIHRTFFINGASIYDFDPQTEEEKTLFLLEHPDFCFIED